MNRNKHDQWRSLLKKCFQRYIRQVEGVSHTLISDLAIQVILQTGDRVPGQHLRWRCRAFLLPQDVVIGDATTTIKSKCLDSAILQAVIDFAPTVAIVSGAKHTAAESGSSKNIAAAIDGKCADTPATRSVGLLQEILLWVAKITEE